MAIVVLFGFPKGRSRLGGHDGEPNATSRPGKKVPSKKETASQGCEPGCGADRERGNGMQSDGVLIPNRKHELNEAASI